MSYIWQRYFLRELAKVFILFIFSFYFLYVLIDYSAHAKTFQQGSVSLLSVVGYYLYQFTKQADILVPVALMIATIKVLTTSNMRGEMIALVVSGVPFKKLMRPFLYAGAVAGIFLYLNFQYLQPNAMSRIGEFEKLYFKEHSKEVPVHTLFLEDSSVLVYRYFDERQKNFFDAYWIQSPDQLYRIKKLYPFETIPMGKYVDSFVRDESGSLIHLSCHEKNFFPSMVFDAKTLFHVVHPPRWQPLSQLLKNLPWRKIGWGAGKMNDREAEAVTYFFYKLLIPLLPFLVIIAPAPFCLRFTRGLPVFFIYALSLFGIITFFTLVNSSVILGASQLIPPLWAIWTPPLLFFLIFGRNYAKL